MARLNSRERKPLMHGYHSGRHAVSGREIVGFVLGSPRRLFYLVLSVLLGGALLWLLLRDRKVVNMGSSNAPLSSSRPTILRDADQQRPPQQELALSVVSQEDHQLMPLEHQQKQQPPNSTDNHHESRNGRPRIPFHATDQWQPVSEDAVLPDGLEIRIDMQTGAKEARLRPSGSASASGRGPGVPQERTGARAQGRIAAHKTAIERFFEQAASKDSSPQQKATALEWLDENASELEMGIAAARARNMMEFLSLLEDPDSQIRLQVATILSGCFHNNGRAAQDVLLTNAAFVPKLLGRLSLEPDLSVRRRIIAILTNVLEGAKPELMAQFVAHGGFAALEKAVAAGVDQPLLERAVVLLALMARNDRPGSSSESIQTALSLLEKHLPQVTLELGPVSRDAFEPLCAAAPRQTNLANFCTRFIVGKSPSF